METPDYFKGKHAIDLLLDVSYGKISLANCIYYLGHIPSVKLVDTRGNIILLVINEQLWCWDINEGIFYLQYSLSNAPHVYPNIICLDFKYNLYITGPDDKYPELHCIQMINIYSNEFILFDCQDPLYEVTTMSLFPLKEVMVTGHVNGEVRIWCLNKKECIYFRTPTFKPIRGIIGNYKGFTVYSDLGVFILDDN